MPEVFSILSCPLSFSSETAQQPRALIYSMAALVLLAGALKFWFPTLLGSEERSSPSQVPEGQRQRDAPRGARSLPLVGQGSLNTLEDIYGYNEKGSMAFERRKCFNGGQDFDRWWERQQDLVNCG